MKRISFFLFAIVIYSCNNVPPGEGTEGEGVGQPLHLPVNFDSTYRLCLGRDTLNVRLVDTSEGIVTYITLPDSTQHTKTRENFIQAVENCFEH